MFPRFGLLVMLFFVLPTSLLAQFQGQVYKPFYTPSVTVNGQPITSPWCGGINSVQINLADLNQDNVKDLILYDQNSNLIRTFLNTGTAGQIRYTYNPKYEANFPALMDYLIMKDYNCDNIPDLFHKGLFGVSVYTGYYQNNELKFTFFKDLFFPGMFGPVNVYVQPGDIPSIIDYDKDGDLDILSFDVLGNKMTYYKNRRVEDALPCDSMRMSEFDLCWGKFFQGIHRTVVTGITCKGGAAEGKKYRHTGNCIVHLDIEGDGDFDLMGGNISYSDAQLLYNNGGDIVLIQDTLYNQGGHQLQMPSWPAPFHCDIDNDGDKDLLFTSHADNLSSANYNAVAYYKNLGTDALPNFVFQHDSLLTPDMIDVGTYSYPTFFDYDKDGKKDLFIGTEGYMNNATGQLESKLAYYRNLSTPGNVAFELVSKDFLLISSHNYQGIFPTFGDVTGDGVDDLLMGNVGGSVAVFKNFAVSNTVTPNFIFYTDSIPGITVTNYSTPLVYDVNQDGKTDLIVGNQLGKLAYYEDTSSTNQKKLALKTINWGNVQAGTVNQLFGYAAPTIARMDNVPKEFLVVGNVDGMLERYDNFVNNWGSFSLVDSNYSYIQEPGRSAPAIADIDGDGNYDMVVGSKLGGLHYYKQVIFVNVPGVDQLPLDVVFYPNPTTGTLHLESTEPFTDQTSRLEVRDLTGRVVWGNDFLFKPSLSFNLGKLGRGIYLCKLIVGNRSVSKKLVIK